MKKEFEDDPNEMFRINVYEIELALKAKTITVADVMSRATLIIDEYIELTGKRPPTDDLDALATAVLNDTYTDTSQTKASDEEYPVMTEKQRERRLARESMSDIWYEYYGSDGRDARPKTRDNRRKDNEIMRLI